MKILAEHRSYAKWFNGEFTENYDEADVIVIAGKGTVNSNLYNSSYMGVINLEKHQNDLKKYKKAIADNKFIIGIGYGAHLVAMYNNCLLLRIDNHAKSHKIIFENEIFDVESSHTFMINPSKGDVIARCLGEISNRYVNAENFSDVRVNLEPEIIWLNETNSLAIQPLVYKMNNTKFTKKLNNKIYELFENKVETSKSQPIKKEHRIIWNRQVLNALRQSFEVRHSTSN